MYLNEDIQNKWKPVLEHEDLPAIKDAHKRSVTAVLLENTEKALREASGRAGGQFLTEAAPANATGSDIDTFDPVLISLVRRAMPNLIAYDICGVQPMTGPTGLIFAMRARYGSQTGDETFYGEVNTAYGTVVTGANTLGQKQVGGYPGNTTTGTANLAETGIYNYGSGMSTAQAEALGTSGNTAFPEMAFSIEKVSVTAKTRALKAEYTMELAQDLKAIHGLDAETELSNILTTEILAEINREVVRTIAVTATKGADSGTTTAGRFDLDVDANGRWSVEKFKGLMFQVEREANQIAKATRRGKGNIIICSSDVASALQMAGVLDYAPALNSNNLQVDDTGATFAGVLNGRIKVYIDPYATGNYMVVGYKGASAFDAGLFYCPYVPLQMVRAVDTGSFQPKIGFKTRYGMVANPFAEGSTAGLGALTKDSNVYYRRVLVDNIL
jgi:Major capsid protein Gp23